MAINIEQFKSAIKDGVSRPNKYQVMITPPGGVTSVDMRKLNIMCESIQFPGCSIASTEDKLFGPIRKMIYLNTYSDVIMNFICSNKMTERKFFDAWQMLAADKINSHIEYYDNYIGETQITTLDESGEPSMLITLRECFPLEVRDQELSYGENNTYLKLQVSMTYRKWDSRSLVAKPSRPSVVVPSDHQGDLSISGRPPGFTDAEWNEAVALKPSLAG